MVKLTFSAIRKKLLGRILMKIRVLSRYRLRIQLIGVNLLIALLAIIIIGGGSYKLHYSQTVSYLDNTTDIYFSEVSEQLEDYYVDLYRLADATFYNNIFQEMMLGQHSDYKEYVNFDNLVGQYVTLVDSVIDLYFYSPYQGNHYFLNDISDLYRIKLGIGSDKAFDNKSGTKLHIISSKLKSESYLYALRPVTGILPKYDSYSKNIGVGVILLEKNSLLKILRNNNLPNSTETYLLDIEDNIIESTTENKSTKLSYRNIKKSYIVKTRLLEGMKPSMKLVCLIPKSILYKEINSYRQYLVMTIIIILMVTLIGSISFNYRLTRPLKELADTFDRVARGNLKSRLKFDYENEITTVEQNFNRMMQDIYTLNKNIMKNHERLYRAELDKKQFQYSSLQNQIKSHFLYNTLTMIRAMAYRGEKREMGELINRLVAYLRYIAKEEQFVFLKAEVEHLKNYMYIQEMRFNNVIKLRKEVDETIGDVPILKLILQPLIENAASHGLGQWNKPGVINVKTERKNKHVLIKVMDNGCGMSKRRLEEVRQLLKSTSEEINHIGLRNIQRRLQLEYSPECSLNIKSWEGIGTIISFEIPYEEDIERGV